MYRHNTLNYLKDAKIYGFLKIYSNIFDYSEAEQTHNMQLFAF